VLAAIMATASLRERLASEGKDLEAFRLIGTACRRGRDVVKSLTHFAQPTLTNHGPLELHALITEVRVLLENTLRNRITIQEVFAGEPLWVQGDVGSLNHALVNLCLNALDAMPEGGTLTLRTAIPEPEWIEVSVEDSGVGMSPEILARVLEPFFTTKEVGKGTGLGLSMTHGVLKAHGGTLELASVLGAGTTVKLRIPRIPTPALETSLEADPPPLRPLTVLLVDDDEDVRFLVTRMLKSVGLLVKSVGSGEAALESLRSGTVPDLVILDQNMPGMNGIQTMERIRVLHPELLILVSSGQPDIEDWACFKHPNVAVIPKPFEMDEILAKLAQLSPKSAPTV
jgi:two-component system cell cycle sensor histidine kinase/response regulator CckA